MSAVLHDLVEKAVSEVRDGGSPRTGARLSFEFSEHLLPREIDRAHEVGRRIFGPTFPRRRVRAGVRTHAAVVPGPSSILVDSVARRGRGRIVHGGHRITR